MKNIEMVRSLPAEELALALNCPLEIFDYKDRGFSSMDCFETMNCKDCIIKWLNEEVKTK